MTDIQQWNLSPSVEEAQKSFGPNEPICAASFTRMLLKVYDHEKEYAGGSLASLQLEDTSQEQTAQEWLDQVQMLFDPVLVQEFTKSTPPATLHGRLLIIGLSLLEPELRQQIEDVGAFTTLVSELDYKIEDILTEQGITLYKQQPLGSEQKQSSDSISSLPVDTVPNWPDDPLQRPEQDLLGRAAFARFLAKRIAAIPTDSGAYAMHLYGAWGAGKSSILGFLRAGLEDAGNSESSEEWLVVEFNAWRNQHIDPPWWSLMDTIFQNTKRKLSWQNRIREYWWRLFSDRLGYVLSAVILMWLLVLGIGWAQQSVITPLASEGKPVPDVLNALATAADNLGKIIALIVTIWGGIVAINRSLLLSSAGAAKNYKDRTYDPMNEIKGRFNTLVARLSHQRVAIFIDDLDRCQSKYVVELLEGIQTLFREAPVVYVVAADRRWLNACYEQVYEKLESQISEPGKSLGTLFLEKAFRFSTPMPGIPNELKSQYWQYLLRLTDEERSLDWDRARSMAQETAASAKGEGELQGLVDASTDRSFVEQQAMREEVAVRLAAPEVIERLEHTLRPYTELLEPNPRAMKRLVNAYSANRALAILSGVDIKRHQLVLWTILSSRWPQLAAYLEDSPEQVEKIVQQDVTDVPADVQTLFADEDVVYVAGGGPVGIPLARGTVEQCAHLHA